MIFSKKYLLVTPNPYTRDREICDSRAGAAAAHITTRSNNGYLLACYDIVLDENGCLQSAKRIGKNEETQGTKWYAYVETPFSRRIGLEWCYLLGDFNVQVFGEFHRITPKTGLLGFADVTTQGLAHYGGNITYCIPVKTNGGSLSVTVPHYAGTGLRCSLNGKQQHILYPPYRAEFDNLPAGEHTLEITLLGNRQNSFGPVHWADLKNIWVNANSWRSVGAAWTESYRLKELGIFSAPVITEICREG